ncbi:N-acetylmuramoyl-L-alanine amidase [Actinomadura sp. 9N215]|uniref:N-acetylmuramoyl-L-alanine amidase n=1 Tax=Actinomadura sp. 9N215 TaxID=3375150 RepID=UPI0037BC5F79
MKLVKRASWGARYGRGNTNITPSRGGVAVHYEGGGKLTGNSHSTCAGRVRAIERFHVQTNGWSGIAYSYLVCEHGYVFEGRGLGYRTAANGTTASNQNYYAVCALIGDRDPAADAIKSGVRDAIDYMRSRGAGSALKGHRQFLPTSCPGSALYAWVRKGAPRPGRGTTPPDPPSRPGPAPGDDWTERIIMSLSTVRRGSTGRAVRVLQGVLCAMGPDIAIDGDFGPSTERRVREEQAQYQISVDGIAGPVTWRVLLTGK